MKKIFVLVALAFSLHGFSQQAGKPLPAWEEGMMDLHHINTGRAEAALYILPDVFRRITSQYLYEGPRDLFATNMMEANKIVIGPSLEKAYKSMDGHILLRVMPGGKEYYVIILNDENTDYEVKAVFGPYRSKKKSQF